MLHIICSLFILSPNRKRTYLVTTYSINYSLLIYGYSNFILVTKNHKQHQPSTSASSRKPFGDWPGSAKLIEPSALLD